MRRPPYHRDDRGRLDVKMTPMIDVIFLLLIFFVCTAGFRLVEEILPTNLSFPGTAADASPIDPQWEDLDEIVVRILWRDGRPGWQINQRDLQDLNEVRAVLQGAAKVQVDLPVILDVEGEVPIEHVIDVYDLCRQIGLETIRFAASAERPMPGE
jgi:biopolymer transport protein ExbD